MKMVIEILKIPITLFLLANAVWWGGIFGLVCGLYGGYVAWRDSDIFKSAPEGDM